jgi:hypothetical protein
MMMVPTNERRGATISKRKVGSDGVGVGRNRGDGSEGTVLKSKRKYSTIKSVDDDAEWQGRTSTQQQQPRESKQQRGQSFISNNNMNNNNYNNNNNNREKEKTVPYTRMGESVMGLGDGGSCQFDNIRYRCTEYDTTATTGATNDGWWWSGMG